MGWGVELQGVIGQHLGVVRTFLSDPKFRSPIITIWVASFGGALHAPVTTFYYLELGSNEVDIGIYGFIVAAGALILAPLYGWMLDVKGSFLVMWLSCALCSVGCLIRGVATTRIGIVVGVTLLGLGGGNLWTVILAHVARFSSHAQRSLHVSAYLVQVGALRILGKLLYAPFDAALQKVGCTETLPRYRVEMGVCTAFCFYGCFELWRSRVVLSSPDIDSAVHPTHSGTIVHRAPIILASLALLAQAIAATVGTVLWPLFLNDQFGWGATEYAYVLFVASLAMNAMTALSPALEQWMGPIAAGVALCVASMIAAMTGFSVTAAKLDGPLTRGIHVLAMIAFLSLIACLEPVLKVLSSLYAPPNTQARAFSLLASIAGVGEMIGNIVGTHLYRINLHSPYSGILPALLSVVVLCGACLLLTVISWKWPPPPHHLATPQELATLEDTDEEEVVAGLPRYVDGSTTAASRLVLRNRFIVDDKEAEDSATAAL